MVILIVGLVATVSVGGLGNRVDRNRLRNESQELVSAIRFAHQSSRARGTLGSGFELWVNFYNAHEFGLEEFDPTKTTPIMVDPGALVAFRTGGLGTKTRLGSPNLPNNLPGDPAPPLGYPDRDRLYFSDAAGNIRVPQGQVADRIVFRGGGGPPILPYQGPLENPTRIFDRIVICNSQKLPPTPGTRRQVIRLNTFSGLQQTSQAAWIEISNDDQLNIP